MTSAVQLKTNASSTVEKDEHAVPHSNVTQAQLTLFIAYMIIVMFWLSHIVISTLRPESHDQSRKKGSVSSDNAGKERHAKTDIHENIREDGHTVLVYQAHVISECENLNPVNSSCVDRKCPNLEVVDTEKKSPCSLPEKDEQPSKRTEGPPVVSFSKFMSSMVVFGVAMFYFFLCDYVKIFVQGEREYSRDTFLFLLFLFFLVGCTFTIKSNQDKILNRDQTEEWKGWMQVMFVWYHYFMAKEWYNWIRIYIACYVWMTGFGNFSFFWIRKDYSLWRLLKMLFRLNFLVAFVAMTTNNDYMLYYICAMHTYWFLTVYIFMRTMNSWNRNSTLMAVKFSVYALCNAVIFDIPGMSYIVFRPFSFILGFHDRSPDILHEWSFRAGLDHWACFVGMLCAYNYPHFEALMQFLDSKSSSKEEEVKKITLRLVLLTCCVLLALLWYSTFMRKDKFDYNISHPYSSMIPIIVFIVIRNIHPALRSHHIHMFAWLGKITLETYLSQLHVYLLSNARTLLMFLPGYPLLNFSMTTITYLFVSHVLFTITNNCSSFLLPSDNKKLIVNAGCICAIFSTSGLIARGF